MDPNIGSLVEELSESSISDSSTAIEETHELEAQNNIEPSKSNERFIEDYDLLEPFLWRTDNHSHPVPNYPNIIVTHAVSPKRDGVVCLNNGKSFGWPLQVNTYPELLDGVVCLDNGNFFGGPQQVNTYHELCNGEDAISHQDEIWLMGGPLGSRNAILVFRSSALANASDVSIHSKPAAKLHITYKVSQAETKLLSKLLDCHGVSELVNNSCDYNLLWTGSHPKPGILRALAPHQRVNHFPRSYELTRKDRLYKNIERMQHVKGYRHFDFIPQTFVMPSEFRDLCSTHYRIKGPWIVKPVASSRGRGIFIVENPNQVPLDEPVVVAKYINKPLLVEGHKCDLRLYVLVTSFDPLQVYIYEEGLVRLATVRYDSSHKQLWNPCMHLCNYSINKYHSDYVKSDDPTAENVGHKWTLSALLRHLKAQGKDTALLMAQIEDVVVKAILSSASAIIPACQMFVPTSGNCFELYGFDILIDEDLKPWLLEVNLSPSLNCDSPLDVRLKSAMLADLLTLVGIPAVDPILRPSASSIHSPSNASVKSAVSSSLKMKLSNCRRVHSADGLNVQSGNTLPKKNSPMVHNNRSLSNSITLTTEEMKVVRAAKAQFERRGGFIRIFPTVDSWAKYSQYLDPVTGIPTTGNNATNTYNIVVPHNYNQMLFTQLFPDVSTNPSGLKATDKGMIGERKHKSLDRKRDLSIDNADRGVPRNRQDRYERMLSQGHRAALLPKKIPLKESQSAELRTQVMEMMKDGKQLTQTEARKAFSQYLGCILKRISASPEQEGHVEIVLKFLQKASNYLRSPFAVKVPSYKLVGKDRAAMVAKQLNDFLYLYNRETEMYSSILDLPSQLPSKLFIQFLENARECDLEEMLVLQSLQTEPRLNSGSGLQSIIKCLPNVTDSACLKIPAHCAGRNSVKVSSPPS